MDCFLGKSETIFISRNIMTFQQLVRVEWNGLAQYGELVDSNPKDGYKVAIFQGNPWDGLTATDQIITVPKVCMPAFS